MAGENDRARETASDVYVIPDRPRFWIRTLFFVTVAIVAEGLFLVYAPQSVLTYLVAATLPILVVGFAVGVSRLVRGGPQAEAGPVSVTLNTWRGRRTVEWLDVVSIGNIGSAAPATQAFFKGAGVRSRTMDEPTFEVRYGDRMYQAVLIHSGAEINLPAARRELERRWRAAKSQSV